MKAITVRQPWADLIARGIKQYETRSWKTEFRGWVAIHAGKADLPDEIRRIIDIVSPSYPKKDFSDLGEMKGYVVAVAKLVDCVPLNDPDKFPSLEIKLGEFGAGRFGWKFEDVRELEVPAKCNGQQGFWNLPDAVVDDVGELNLGYIDGVELCYSSKG